MTQYLFKIYFFVLLGTLCPGSISAETLRVTTNRNLTIFQKLSISCQGKEQKIIKWEKKVGEKYVRFFGKGKENGRGGKIAAIVFLALGIILFGLFGFAILLGAVEGWYFWGTGFAIFLVLISLVFLALSVLCIRGVIKVIRKLHRLKYGEPPEELPRRPPSRNLKHQ